MSVPSINQPDAGNETLAMVRQHPWAFVVTVLKAFKANQGLLPAGALGCGLINPEP